MALAVVLTAVLLTTIRIEAQTWAVRPSTTGADLLDVAYSTAATAAAVGNTSVTIASGDGGLTWTDKTVAGLTADGSPNLNAVFSSGPTIVGVGNDQMGGAPEAVITSNDRGATWVEVINVPNTTRNLTDGLFVNSTHAVAVSDNMGGGGVVLLSVDRGASWTNPYVGTVSFNAVDARGALVIAVGDNIPNEELAYSLNGGVTWLAGAGPGVGQNMNDVAIVSATTAVAVGQAGEILRTTDSGVTWTNPFTVVGTPNLNAVDVSGTFLIAVGDNRTIARSVDSGANWVLPTTPPPVGVTPLNNVRFLTSSIALVVGDAGEIYSSSDRGDTWVTQTSTTGQNLTAIAYNGVNNTLVVGAAGTVLLSEDQIPTSAPIPFQSKWPLVLLLVGAGLFSLRRLRTAR